MAESDSIPFEQGLSLRGLAAILKVPPYRLSICFNTRLNTSIPSWFNALRVEKARQKMIERPDWTILDVAVDAGYGSRTVFNDHFSRIVGMSPSEYRRLRSPPADGTGTHPAVQV